MDADTIYLYRSFNTNIYMKISEVFNIFEVYKSKDCNMYSIKLQRPLYGTIDDGNASDLICLCVYIK